MHHSDTRKIDWKSILSVRAIDLDALSKGMDADELENLNIALNTMKSMNREDILNLQKNNHPKKK